MSYELDSDERAVAERVLAELAPDELPLLGQLIRRPTWRDRFQGQAVGYGLDSSISVFAPYVVLAVVWAKSVVADEAKAVMGERLRRLTRRVLRADDSDRMEPPPTPPHVDEAELVLAITTYGTTLGLKKKEAELLAAAVVGALLSPFDQ